LGAITRRLPNPTGYFWNTDGSWLKKRSPPRPGSPILRPTLASSKALPCSTHRHLFDGQPRPRLHGREPYIRHGILGREILEALGCPATAWSATPCRGRDQRRGDPPFRPAPAGADMRPVTVEEQIICYADKFFSKKRR